MLVGRVVQTLSAVPGSIPFDPLTASSALPEVSVVVPGLNEAESLPELARRINQAIGSLLPYELIFIDDGSTDETWQRIAALHEVYPNVRGVSLRKNFGKAMALTAG